MIYVIGDIHGNYKGLMQCLERCNFDYKNDTLISLGDVVDGHCDSYEVVEELLKIKNLIAIRGNHDDAFNEFLVKGLHPFHWSQGAKATGESYLKQFDPNDYYLYDYSTGIARCRLTSAHIKDSHIRFFENQLSYYLDDKKRLFVHGGFNRHFPIEEQSRNILLWDRDLWSQALSWEKMSKGYLNEKPKFKIYGNYSEIFIGHTSTQFWNSDQPMNAANIWNLDTGGGWFGRVTIMNVDTKEFWQSDKALDLYPEYKGRVD